MNNDLPDHLASLDSFVGQLVSQVNTQHAAGAKQNGRPRRRLLQRQHRCRPRRRDHRPRPTSPQATPPRVRLDGGNATALAGLDMGSRSYRETITSFGVKIASAQRGAINQSVLASQVDASREALSGISIDEEMVNLLAAQRGYEGASRVLTTIDSVLDTLINRTGLLR